MKVIIAIDSLKGCLPSLDAGEAARRGVLAALPEADTAVYPIADGGEGTVRALTARGGRLITMQVTGPLGEPISAEYGILADGCAVIEMAAAAGLPLVPKARRNPMYTTTYGVGELIADAIHRGCRRFLIGIGGSATNDGGAGMLGALGFRLLDREGHPIPHGAAGLLQLDRIETAGAMKELAECEIRVACDVENPLLGELGASAVFAPQKGASSVDIPILEEALTRLADATEAALGQDVREAKGAGAAGGLGFALLAYLGARLSSGIMTVMEMTGLFPALAGADLVLTGEGRLDGQSAMGKAPAGVAAAAKREGAAVVALGGSVNRDAAALHTLGVDALFPILRTPCTLDEAMNPKRAADNIEATALEVTRLFLAAKKLFTKKKFTRKGSLYEE